MDFNNLKLFRKQKGFTQEQIAERLGVSRQAVAKWERGETLPDIDNIIALADMYDVTIDSLVRNLASLPENNCGKKYMFGVTKVDDKGKIALPKKCREVFHLNTGDAVLVLGDEDRGIAVIKISEIFEG